MKQNKAIVLIVCISCLLMAFIDAVISPQYLIKSVIKVLLFTIVPVIYSVYDKNINLISLFKIKKNGINLAILSGILVFAVIISLYFIFGDFFDLSNIVLSLSDNIGVNKSNFIFVSIYISFVNSLLEEFFFRGFAFIKLKQTSSRRFAYIFSSFAFTVYHIAMMIGWFDITVFLLTLSALFIGGLIFNYFNEKFENIYISWLIHMFANFAINTIGFILFNKI